MILQALKEYGERVRPTEEEGIVSDAFEDNVRIQWWLEIDNEGNFLGLQSRAEEHLGPKGKKFVTFPPLSGVPKSVSRDRSQCDKPYFLSDNAEYWFGVSAEGDRRKSLDSHIRLAEAFATRFARDPRAQAVKKFFDRLQTGNVKATWDKDAQRGEGKLVIEASGIIRRFPVKLRPQKERIALYLEGDDLRPLFQTSANLRAFWSEQYQGANEKRQKLGGAAYPPCLCCGLARPPVETFGPYKGLASQPVSLVFTGKPAYESYGFKKGENAAVCLECSQSIVRGLEALLQSPSSSKRLEAGKPRPGQGEKSPPAVFAFWTRQPVEFDFGKAGEGDLETVKRVLESVHRGVPQDIAQGQFFILGISESYRRTMLRYWSELNAEDVLRNLAAWFEGLRGRLGAYGLGHKPPSLLRLCQTAVRQPSQTDDQWLFPPILSTGLFLSAFLRKPIPPPVLQMLVNRVRTIAQSVYDAEAAAAARKARKLPPDYKLKPERMALLRLTVNRLMKDNDQPFDVGLDVDRREPEYHCGRLLAVCDDAMRWSNSAELGKPGKSTVADRYMGSASSAPCSVLPVVYRNSRHHISKLRRDLPGKSVQLEKLLDEILSKLTSYPAALTPRQAGIFILGFHHQRQFFFLVSRYGKLKKQREEGKLLKEDEDELEALEDFVNRARFDASLLADLPDEAAPEAPSAESE